MSDIRYRFEDETPMDWNSLCKRELLSFSDKELSNAYHYLWSQVPKIKGDIIHPYATMVSLEIDRRSSSVNQNRTNLGLIISMLVLLLTTYFSTQSYGLTRVAVDLAREDSRGDLKWMKLQNEKFTSIETLLNKQLLVLKENSRVKKRKNIKSKKE